MSFTHIKTRHLITTTFNEKVTKKMMSKKGKCQVFKGKLSIFQVRIYHGTAVAHTKHMSNSQKKERSHFPSIDFN